jgi:hypothetical protein
MAPTVPIGIRASATLFFFWAGLGMALYLLSDFLAALFFAVFMYGLLFWRHRSGLAIAAGALAIATLLRPTFTIFPVLLPFLAWFVGRCTSKISNRNLLLYVACSMAATGVSVGYQYAYSRYLGPSPNLINPIRETLYGGVVKGRNPSPDYETFKKEFEREVEKRARREYVKLSPTEEETYAKAIFRDEFAAHPIEIGANFAGNFIKYLFVPVESNVMRLVEMDVGDRAYFRYVRPIVGAMCLPIWILSFVPPLDGPKKHRMFYWAIMTCVVYVVGLSAIGTGAGERYRFPLLMFMLPVAIWNAQWIRGYGQAWLAARRDHRAATLKMLENANRS